jgi:hypothetical protein
LGQLIAPSRCCAQRSTMTSIISLSADSDHAIVVIEGWNGERKHFATAPSKILSDTTTQ